MQAATAVPVDVVTVLQALIVLFIAAPALVREVYRLRAARAGSVAGGAALSKGWNGMSVAVAAPRAGPLSARAGGRCSATSAADCCVCWPSAGRSTRRRRRPSACPLSATHVHIPDMRLPARNVAFGFGALVPGVRRGPRDASFSVAARRTATAAVLLATVFSLLLWGDAGQRMGLVGPGGLLNSTVDRSLPLVLGALAGRAVRTLRRHQRRDRRAVPRRRFHRRCRRQSRGPDRAGCSVRWPPAGWSACCSRCLRSVTSSTRSCSESCSTCSRSVSPTSSTTASSCRTRTRLNSPPVFDKHAIPGLVDIPVLGPALFDATHLQYLAYAAASSPYMSRCSTRAGGCGRVRSASTLQAADTVGIRVLATRYRNVVAGGAIAGIGGAYFTIGSVGAFGEDISSGKWLHRLGRTHLRSLEPAGRRRRRAAVRLRRRAAEHPVGAGHVDPLDRSC